MKIILLHIFFFFTVIIPLVAQESILDKKISIKSKNETISTILSKIEKDNHFYFSYSNNSIPADSMVSIKVRKKPLRDILNELLNENDYEFIIVENQVIVKKREGGRLIDPNKKYILSGFINDNNNGEPVIGASVFVSEIRNGTTTNPYGFYSLSLPMGNYTVEYSYLGYKKKIQRVNLGKNTRVSMPLENEMQILQEIVVEGKKNIIEKSQISELRMRPTNVSTMPSFMGSPDLLKSIQYLPGILPHSDGSSFFYVRGGNRDQNLILIDDAPVYSTSHLFGFFTSVVPEAINDVKIYKGDFPINYGGRISSVLDIHTREGNSNHFNMDGTLGLFTSRISVQGPFKKEKSSYFFSIRKSNLDWLMKKVGSGLDINFYDMNFKTNLSLNQKNKIFFSFYSGKDNMLVFNESTGNAGFTWKNFTTSLRWNHIYNEKLFQNTILYLSSYENNLIISDKNGTSWKSNIVQTGLKLDYTYYKDSKNTWRFGGGLTSYFFNPGNIELNQVVYGGSGYIPNAQKKAQDLFLYAGNEYKFSEKLSMHYGLRAVVWNNVGKSQEYIYDANHQVTNTIHYEKSETYHTYFDLEPRAGIKYTIDSISSLKLSYSRITQHLQLLSNSMSPFSAMEVWYPSGPNILPQKADQVVAGYFRELPRKFILSVETYYKYMHHQTEYSDHANTLLNPYIEGELRFGSARAYGLELMLKKESGRFNGWMSYSLAKVRKQIAAINDNKPYPPFNDRLHAVAFCLQFEASKFWVFSANWIFATGAAFSTPTGFYYYQGSQVPVYSSRNNDRLPSYHRLDVGILLRLNPNHKGHFEHAVQLSLYNVYNRHNPVSVTFNKTRLEDQSLAVPSNVLNNAIVVPTSLALTSFIPSINYTLSF